MKRPLMLLVSLVGAGVLAQGDILNLNPVRTETQKLLEARQRVSPGQAFDLSQLKELHRAIVGNRPNVWAMPGPMLQAMQGELESLRPVAKQLAESAQSDERYYGAILNSYLKQTDESRTLLLKLAHDERPETAGTAMDTLFGLKLDTPELRAELVQALQEDKPPREHSTMHSLARNSAGQWNLTEAVPALIALAEKTYQTEKRIDSVVKQLKLLGPAAAKALPTLNALLEKRRADGDADFREIEALEHAVLVISGQYKAPGPGASASPTQQPGASSPPSASAKPAPPVAAVEAPAVNERGKVWPWLVGAIVLVLAVLLVLKRRE